MNYNFNGQRQAGSFPVASSAKHHFLIAALCAIAFFLVGCFSEKGTPFYDSEWLMPSVDAEGKTYYHQLILTPDRNVVLRVTYADSSKGIVWTGTYRLTAKKIVFDFTDCVRYEKGTVTGKYTSGKMIKFYAGDFFYSVGEVTESDGSQKYHLQLIRPKNYFYRDANDIFGNPMDEFVKTK